MISLMKTGRQQARPLNVARHTGKESAIERYTFGLYVRTGTSASCFYKRAADKDSFPGCYDTSSSGHIHAGDEPITSALRELYEELGITAHESDLNFAGRFHVAYEKEFYGKMFRDNEVAFVYVYTKPVEISKLTLQKEEVESVKWFDMEEIQRALEPRDSRFCVPTDGFKLAVKWCKENIQRIAGEK